MIEEARRVLQLSWPMIVAQLGHMTMAVVDAIVVGRTGTDSLAAMALGHIWIWGTLMIANGIVMGVDPVISQACGAGDGPAVARAFQRGLVFAAVLSLPLAASWLVTEPVLGMFGQDPKLSQSAAKFVAVQAPSAVFFLMFSVNRQYLGGRGLGRAIAFVVLAGNVVNAVLCWALVFGRLGLPAMGLLGAGISQGLARAFLGVALAATTFGFGLHRGAWVPWSRSAFDRRALAQIAALGVPLGVQFGLEAWAFQIAALLAGRLGAEALAANTIVLNLAATSFMVPLGLSMGASIRVGLLIGAGDPLAARKSSIVSFALGASFMSLSAVTFFVFRNELPHLYGATPAVASLAATVFPIAAAFQLFDGAQVVGGGVLRGMGRTRPAALLNLAGYYAVALPLAYLLAFTWGGGLRGLWMGLAIGLFLVAAGILPLTVRKSAFRGLRRVAT